jgi:hypothetical protein
MPPVADDDDRFAVMGQGFEMTFLRIGQREHWDNPDNGERFNSVTGGKGLTVAPSPLNEVKLDLGIILAVGVVLAAGAGAGA